MAKKRTIKKYQKDTESLESNVNESSLAMVNSAIKIRYENIPVYPRIQTVPYKETNSKGLVITYKSVMPIRKTPANNIFEIIDNSRKGLTYKEFEKVKNRLNLTNNDWCSILNISERTLQRYSKDKKSFDSLQSEKIYEIAMLFDYGVTVFGSEEKFLLWLDYQSIPLGKVKPKSLFDTGFGIDLVKTELSKIEHGILA